MAAPVLAPVSPRVPLAVASLAIASYVGMDAAMKGTTLAIGVYNAMFWRALVGLALSGAVFAAIRPSRPGAEALTFHALRGSVGTAMAIAWFWGIARLPLAEAIALSFIAPLIALFLAGALLGERVGASAVGGSLLGLAGVLLIVLTRAGSPLGADGLAGAASILGSAVLYAFNIVLMRRQAQVAGPAEISFFGSLVVSALLLIAAPWLAALPPTSQLPGIGIAAALALGASLLLAWSYARAEAQALAPVEYTAIVWGALLGWLVFGENVGIATVAGGLLIVAGCWIAARQRPLADGQVQSPAEAAT